MTSMPINADLVSHAGEAAIGAVVIGRNEGARLLNCLNSLHGKVEKIVYVDSASVDGSAVLARQHGAIVVELIADIPLTAARGRRVGLERLLREMPQCRLVQFIDGDCILQEGWMEAATAFLDHNPDCAVVFGRRFEAHPQATFYNQLIDHEWDTPIGKADSCGGDALSRTQALLEVGSYRAELLAGEEPELCSRLRASGWSIWRIDAEMTEHDAGIEHLLQWFNRARRGGAGYAQVWSATRQAGHPLYGRQIGSALLWTLVVPVASILLALGSGSAAALLLAPLAWIIQTYRISRAYRPKSPVPFRFKAAALMMLTKFAEVAGILTFWMGGKKLKTSYRDGAVAPATRGG